MIALTDSRLGAVARGHLAMLLFSALVAGSFSLGAIVANDIAPAALNAVRFLVAGIIIGALAALGPGFRRVHFEAPWRYLLLGGLYAIYFVLMFEGLKTAPAVATAAVFTLTPVMTVLFGWIVLRQATSRRSAVALAIGAGGALWVIFRADIDALLAFRVGQGEAIYFVGCVSHALFTPMLRRLNRGEPAMVSTALVIAGGCVVLTGWGWGDLLTTDWGALKPVVWITLAYVTVFASATTFFLLQHAALRLPSAKVMAYTYLVPSWVILWEVALGRPAPTPLVLAGLSLTAVALLILLKDENARP